MFAACIIRALLFALAAFVAAPTASALAVMQPAGASSGNATPTAGNDSGVVSKVSNASSHVAQGHQGFTTNPFCRQNRCVNPLFPAFDSLVGFGDASWQCPAAAEVKSYLSFCKDIIDYHPLIPSPKASANLSDIVRTHEDAAVTAYFYHLAGLSMNAWNHRKGDHPDPCTEAVRKMVCMTYFPRAEPGCSNSSPSSYVRPCANVCSNYIAACEVKCCDESSRCSFRRNFTSPNGSVVEMRGYPNEDGETCTSNTLSYQFLQQSGGFSKIGGRLLGVNLGILVLAFKLLG